VALSAFYCISSGKDTFSKNRKDEELEGGLRGLGGNTGLLICVNLETREDAE